MLTIVGSALQGDDHVLALGIYLGIANLIGWILSVEVERRERALFWSSKQLTEATHALEAMARNAAEANTARTQVLAAVSHDLRQPLASLSLYARLLRARNDVLEPSGLLPMVDRLDACVTALNGNLDRLSELGGLRSREAPLPVTTVDLRVVLERIESVHAAEASRRGVRLVVRRPRAGREFVISNENRLWDVLSNLVGNALKFGAAERAPWVLVGARRLGDRLVVDVRDNGVGIALADQRRVFDEYFQVGNRERNPDHGYGLGLSIVRETVLRLPGHSIALASRPDRGARFSVSLPAAGVRPTFAMEQRPVPWGTVYYCDSPRAAYVGRDSREPVDGNALEGVYVLFIEDDDSMRDALGQVLQQWGVLVDAAVDGEEARRLAASAERSFDAIVSDYRLPGDLNGLRLIDELRSIEGQRTPAILLSGEFSVEMLRRQAPHDVHVMAKPPDVARLRSLLGDLASGGGQLSS